MQFAPSKSCSRSLDCKHNFRGAGKKIDGNCDPHHSQPPSKTGTFPTPTSLFITPSGPSRVGELIFGRLQVFVRFSAKLTRAGVSTSTTTYTGLFSGGFHTGFYDLHGFGGEFCDLSVRQSVGLCY